MLPIDERLFEIDAVLEALTQEVLASSEASSYRLAKKAFEEDADLQEKVARLDENRAFLTYRPEIRALQKEIALNEKVYQLKLAENELQALLSALTEKIAASISPTIAVNTYNPIKGGTKHAHRRI
ncbi:MAG: YlbF family regulator [Streptococcaceae bacterium]|jgi:cell fate (sporulation/competence/biofilm development) regulator YlbF (YheA/YmcA/DUF963 family)|nr:YlbF family regulator [Streptococcaceae bacterium]